MDQKVILSKIQAALGNLESSGMESFIFPKGKTRVRLCIDPTSEIVKTVSTEFQGRKKQKFLFLSFSVDDEAPTWKGLIVPKTVARGILELSTEFQLFSPDRDGHGITILRTGEGLRSVYTVNPSKSPVAIPESLLSSRPTLQELAEQYESRRERQDSSAFSSEDEDDEGSW
ncbi:MAG: hypothetical protein DSO01_05935 [Archaeoglobi archaeon]|nr:MAG: hypothetical protein DSO01_05935 [Archaeoglobi archaeon]